MRRLTVVLSLFCIVNFGYSRQFGYDNSEDYLYQDFKESDRIFIDYKPVELEAEVGLGSQCGKISLKNTMKGVLKNLYSERYLNGLVAKLAYASPELFICMLNPKLCNFIKQTKINLNLLAKFRLDQCAIIDKYTTKRASEYTKSRANCIGKRREKGDNLEMAIEACNSDVFDKIYSLTGENKYVTTQKVVNDSLKWLGVKDSKTRDLVYEMVGDTVITKGKVRLDIGSAPSSSMLLYKREEDIQQDTYAHICKDIVERVHAKDTSIQKIVSSYAVKEKFAKLKQQNLINVETLENLSKLPLNRQKRLCKELANAISTEIIRQEIIKAHKLLSAAQMNPHMGDAAAKELQKRIDLLNRHLKLKAYQKTKSLGEVMAFINSEGSKITKEEAQTIRGEISKEIAMKNIREELLFNCVYEARCQ